MWEEIDVCITISGQHSDSAVFADKAVPDRETLFFFCNVFQCVGCGGVNEL